MFKTYIDAVVDINAKDVDDSNRTALHKAALAGNKDILDILLSYGGDIFAVSGDGVTALYLAEVIGESEVVERILQRGQYNIYSLIK
jgi:ankyrin repeat protein